jgi:DNA-binding phage protein
MTEVVFSPVDSNWEGYYEIPNHSKNHISPYGVVIDAVTGNVVSTHKSTGYVYVCIHHDDIDAVKPIGIHRLLAMAFYGPPPSEKAIPNHRDGVKDNNFKSNIEWSSYSGNIDHAYRNNLRTDNRPILVKDLRDGSVMRFHAMAECARHFNVSTERIWRNVRDNTGNIYFNYYVFRFEDDTRPWPALTSKDIGKVNNGESKETLALELETRQVIEGQSISQIATETGVKMTTVAYALRTGKQYPVKGYVFKLKNDPTPWLY